MMVRKYLLGLLLLSTTAARAQEQQPSDPPPSAASAEPAASQEAVPPPEAPAAPSQLAPPPSALTPAEQRALIEGRQQMLRDQRVDSEREQQRRLVEGRQQLLHDRRFHDQPAAEPEHRASDEQARPRFSIALSLDSLFYNDPGYDLFDDNDVSSRFGLWGSYDVAELAPRTVLAIELGAGFESHEQAVWEGQLQSELDSQTFSVGASLRYGLLSWLDPQLRAAGGLSLFAFQLKTDDETGFEDHAVSGFASLGAGVLLHTPERLFETKQGSYASFEVGFLIEAGYALRSAVEFELDSESSALPIALTQASLGELALAGPYIRSSLLVRF
jgi:hypothetical protein